jgi:hypothetical protein
MPAHDRDGIIVDTLQLDGANVYVVSYRDNPHLRVSVKPENIRDWVSARTHEQWDRDQVKLRKEEEMRIRDENRKGMKGGSRANLPEGVKGKPGRKRKRAPSPSPVEQPVRRASALGTAILPPPSGPGRRRKQHVEEEPVFTSPNAQKSQGPSLSTPVKGLTVMDLDTDDEDMDDNAALARQLNAGLSGSNMQSSRSTTGTSRRSSRGASLLDDNQAVAGTSSRAARQIYEDLEDRRKKDKPQTITEKYSILLKKPSSQFSPRPGMFSPPKDYKSPYRAGSPSKSYKSPYPNATNPNPANLAQEYGVEVEEDEIVGAEVLSEEEDYDAEYEIDKIMDDEMRKGEDGKQRLYYLIKWVGTWDDTWEPAFNVGEEAIKDYKETKRKEGRTMNLDGTDDGSNRKKAHVEDDSESDEDRNELFVTPNKGKGKAAQPVRGQVIDDYSDDSD